MTSAAGVDGTTQPSPCVNICRMHEPSGWCEGCARSLGEIAAWSRMDDAGKAEVLAQLPVRRAVLTLQYGLAPGLPASGSKTL